MYLIPSDSVFQYNTMGIDENQNLNNEGGVQIRNNDEETYVNNGGERIRYKNEPGMEMIEVSSNKSLRHKSLDSEKTEYENINNKLYDAMNKNYTNSIGSSIPLPPNTENMVFMGKEAQEELKIFQQQQQQQHISNYNQKEKLVELGLMSTNDHSYPNKSSKGTTYVNYDYSNNKSTDRQFSSMDYNKSNDKYAEHQNSFNGLDLNSENFHNSKTFDKIEKKFINNLNNLRTTSPNDSIANKTKEESEMNESNFFANIPGLQIQQYYNQLNLSMEDSNTTNNDWTNSQSKLNSPTNDNENKFDKIIPSGIFTTNKTSWDTDEESFSSNDSSFRNTKNTKNNTLPNGGINTGLYPKSKLGTEYMVIDDDSYSMEQIEGNSRREGGKVRENHKSIDNDDKSYSRYKSGGTTTDNDYSKYQSGFTEDSKYKSVLSTEDDLSKYQSGVTIEDPKFRSGLTIDIPKYSSGITIGNQEDRYRSGVTLDSNGKAISNNMNFAMSPIMKNGHESTALSPIMKTGHDSTALISPINGPSISLISPIMKNGPNSNLFSPILKNSGNKSSVMLPAKNADRMLKTSSNLRVMSSGTEDLFSDMSKLSGFAEVQTDNEIRN